METEIRTETKTVVDVNIDPKDLDVGKSFGMSKVMVIVVGSAGYNMATYIRREAKDEALRNARYVFADKKYDETAQIKKDEDGNIFMNLSHIDLDNDIPADFFQDIAKVYIVAGMGRRTGTEWASIIGHYAKRKGVKSVIAVVSKPFAFEGMRKIAKAHEGIARIRNSGIDAIETVNYEELIARHDDFTFYNAFDYADKAILTAIEEMNMETKITTETKTTVSVNTESEEKQNMDKVAPKGMGKLDMVIAFDTTGSMAAYIEDVRQQVADMIPRLFKDNEDLRLGIVAFGDYCDMKDRETFGDAYQCVPLTDNENDIIKFVKESRNTSGGDGDEFYELVLKKIIDESPWREDSTKAILLIADADPHEIGYTYRDYVVGNQISWKVEAQRAANMKIKIDTVSIAGRPWYKEVSAMTNGISVPFKSSGKTGTMIETATTARSAMAFAESAKMAEDEDIRAYSMSRMHTLRDKLSCLFTGIDDEELNDVYDTYSKEIDKSDE